MVREVLRETGDFLPRRPFHTPIPWRELKYACWLPLYLLAFFLVERRTSAAYWFTQLPIDSRIPFCEPFILAYCAWYPLLIGVGLYLLARDRQAYRRYMAFLAITFWGSMTVWFLLPSCQDLRPIVMPRDNLFTRWISVLYAIDTNTNVFPSGHVVGSVGAALAVWDSAALRNRKAVRWGVTILAALICLSTLLVKQHTVLDVLGGLVLSLIAGIFVYRAKKNGSPI